MGGIETNQVIIGLAKLGAETLTDRIDFLVMKLEVVSIALESCSVALKELNKVEEAITVTLEKPMEVPADTLVYVSPAPPYLMLPAPEKRKGGKNALCPVCKKFCKKGETIHDRCKEKEKA